MYPPIPFFTRVCTKHYSVPEKEFKVEKGIKIMISTYGVHHDPEIYPNPEKFDPLRFSEGEKSKRHPADYLGYGLGPRDCNGKYSIP